ncbi:MAG: hypothetical protein OJF58_002025 [Enhydrobacter sp.]|nr:MAG: hypothetical protein OJF58_002025 [Enhydrobacter sp.]
MLQMTTPERNCLIPSEAKGSFMAPIEESSLGTDVRRQ